MKLKAVVVALGVMFSTAVLADSTHESNNNGNNSQTQLQGQGQQQKQNQTQSQIANGGQGGSGVGIGVGVGLGGEGGKGGNATSNSSAQGGNATARGGNARSNSSSNSNSFSNSNSRSNSRSSAVASPTATNTTTASPTSTSTSGVTASGNTSGTGGSSSVNYTSSTPEAPNKVKIVDTPAVFAPAIGTSAPCAVAASGGLAGMGFGISAGKAFIDDSCTAREDQRLDVETARTLSSMGKNDMASEVLCSNPRLRERAPKACNVPPKAEVKKPDRVSFVTGFPAIHRLSCKLRGETWVSSRFQLGVIMRAIIIEEERFAEILEILKKQCVTDNPFLML
jgi:hypothetical protein